MKKVVFMSLFVLAWVCFVPTPLRAIGKEKKSPNGFYLSGNFLYNMVGGSFDGKHYYDLDSEIGLLPKMKAGMGFGGSLGYKTGPTLIEIGFTSSQHDYTYEELPGSRVKMNLFNFSVMELFNTRRSFQTFIKVELGVVRLYVKNGAWDLDLKKAIGSIRYPGGYVCLGGGFAYFINRRIFVKLGADLRVLSLSFVNRSDSHLYDLEPFYPLSLGLNSCLTFVI